MYHQMYQYTKIHILLETHWISQGPAQQMWVPGTHYIEKLSTSVLYIHYRPIITPLLISLAPVN